VVTICGYLWVPAEISCGAGVGSQLRVQGGADTKSVPALISNVHVCIQNNIDLDSNCISGHPSINGSIKITCIIGLVKTYNNTINICVCVMHVVK